MPLPAKRPASYADLMELPPNLVGEIINGRVVAHPRPAPKHAWASTLLGGRLMRPFHEGDGGPGGWIILDEPELHLGQEVLVPDIAGWRRERLPRLPESAWIEIAPDWVCEVLSPSTARLDRAEKMPLYAAFGVAHLWLVDPEAQTLEVLARHESGHWLLLATLQGEEEVAQPPFAAAPFRLSVLWP